MGLAQIENPNIAFNSAGQDNLITPARLEVVAISGGAVVIGTAVAFTINTAGQLVATAAGVAQIAQAGGFALDSASAAGQPLRVSCVGLTQVAGGASVAAGAAFAIGANGLTAAASATIGSNWGIAIQAQSAGGALYWAWVGKM